MLGWALGLTVCWGGPGRSSRRAPVLFSWEGTRGTHAGGYCPTAGGYCPTAGGYCPTAGGYCPTAGGYCPTAGGYCPTAGGYCPTAGHRPTADSTAQPLAVTAKPLGVNRHRQLSSTKPAQNPGNTCRNEFPKVFGGGKAYRGGGNFARGEFRGENFAVKEGGEIFPWRNFGVAVPS